MLRGAYADCATGRHWYYEDFVRDLNKTLPSMPVKRFTQLMFRACPMLREFAKNHEEAFERFMKYKLNVPVCGAIILNPTIDKCLLVKGWKTSSGWGFPKGKINETEPTLDCAIREVSHAAFRIIQRLNDDQGPRRDGLRHNVRG